MRTLTFRITSALTAFAIGVAAANTGGVFRSLIVPEIPSAPVAAILPEPLSNTIEIKSEPTPSEPEWNPPMSPPHIARLLEVGDYHGNEVNARTGEHWLGLYVTSKGSILKDYILKVTTVRDEIVDNSDPHAKTGKRVSVNRQPDPLLLVKGALPLRPGAVNSVFVGRLSLGSTTNIDLTLGGTSYGLFVKTTDTSSLSSINRDDAKLILSKGEESEQVIYDLGGNGGETEAYWELLWAGDMDGDNKLDLYVQVGYHYNGTQRKLFLSSQAKKGKLVREVAELETWGC